jgi:hypothetical protein
MKKYVQYAGMLFVIFGLFGCVSINQADKNYALSYKPALGSARTSVSFEGAEYLKAREDQKAEKELRKPDYSGIPAVGIIHIRINDGFLEGANPKNSTYILMDNTGREIYRSRGKDKIPDYEVSSFGGNASTLWSSYDSFTVDDSAVEFPLTLRVVRFGNETVDITITKSAG